MNLGIDDVIRPKRDAVLQLAAKHGIIRVQIFGSLARNEADKTSDIDLLVEFEPGRSLLDQSGFQIETEELLGRRVDVAEPDGLHRLVRDRILQEAVPL